jgi:hypothetical protein
MAYTSVAFPFHNLVTPCIIHSAIIFVAKAICTIRAAKKARTGALHGHIESVGIFKARAFSTHVLAWECLPQFLAHFAHVGIFKNVGGSLRSHHKGIDLLEGVDDTVLHKEAPTMNHHKNEVEAFPVWSCGGGCRLCRLPVVILSI